MKRNAVAINTMEIHQENGKLPEWVKLVPAGLVKGRDGRNWVNDRPDGIIANFKELARDLPIDVEHSTEIKGPRGEPAPAIGWVQEIEERAGAIWGRVAWNATGKQLVEGQAYRYLSPVIIYEQTSGTIVGVTSVGATNQPNFRLPALNHEQGTNTPEESNMFKAILAALGLPENSTEAEAVSKIGGLKSDLATATNRAESPSLEKFVPRADYDAALGKATNAEQQLAAIKSEQLETTVTSAIDKALQDGKITPATADYHKAQCRQNGGLERFAAFCAVAPVLGDASNLSGKSPDDTTKALNAEQQKVADLFGNSAEDLAKYGK
ncbi:MAG: phage protease [Proteobacteria bacterium]|nr:phage protease [Pseudomonadota bacterium]